MVISILENIIVFTLCLDIFTPCLAERFWFFFQNFNFGGTGFVRNDWKMWNFEKFPSTYFLLIIVYKWSRVVNVWKPICTSGRHSAPVETPFNTWSNSPCVLSTRFPCWKKKAGHPCTSGRHSVPVETPFNTWSRHPLEALGETQTPRTTTPHMKHWFPPWNPSAWCSHPRVLTIKHLDPVCLNKVLTLFKKESRHPLEASLLMCFQYWSKHHCSTRWTSCKSLFSSRNREDEEG